MTDRLTFQYRIVQYDDGSLGLHEVYYRNGTPAIRTALPAVRGEDHRELVRNLAVMLQAARNASQEDDWIDDSTHEWE